MDASRPANGASPNTTEPNLRGPPLERPVMAGRQPADGNPNQRRGVYTSNGGPATSPGGIEREPWRLHDHGRGSSWAFHLPCIGCATDEGGRKMDLIKYSG